MSDNPRKKVQPATRPQSETELQNRRIPPYNVVLANDEIHSLDFVVAVLTKALGYSSPKARQLTDLAHSTGRAVVWTGTREVAELKLEQITSFHETEDDGTRLGPLSCTIEPAPGA